MKTPQVKASGQGRGGKSRITTFVVRVEGSQVEAATLDSSPRVEFHMGSQVKRKEAAETDSELVFHHTFSSVQATIKSFKELKVELEYLLRATTTLYLEEGLERAMNKQRALVDIFASDVPAPRYNMREAKMIARAQEKVISGTEWVSAADLSDLAGMTSTNRSSGPAKWKSDRKIFSVKYKAEELYPIYALDKNNGFKPLKGLKPILELFEGKKDSWGIAYWFAGTNGNLGGKRPLDLIGSAPELLLLAAKDELVGVTHG